MKISNVNLKRLWLKLKCALGLCLIATIIYNLTVTASNGRFYMREQQITDMDEFIPSEDEDDDFEWATDSDIRRATNSNATNSNSSPATAPNAVMTEAPGTISGYVWADANENGLWDNEESLIADITMRLFAGDDKLQAIDETQTGENGVYKFENLTPGEYYVAVESQIIADREYLIPIAVIQTGADNQFDADWEHEPIRSYTKLIQIEEQRGAAGINAGMRLDGQMVPLAGNYIVTKDTNPPGVTETVGLFGTLQAAVDACDTDSYDYTIILMIPADSLNSAVTIPGDRTITLTSGAGNQNTIVQNGGARHLIVAADSSLTLENIILEGMGYTKEDDRPDNNGGIHITADGLVTLGENAVVEQCYAKGGDGGGGVYVDSGTLNLDGGTIINNQTHSWGAGIMVKNTGSVTVNDGGVVTGNQAFWDGGGIRGEDKATITINKGGEIRENEALHGGGICARSESTVILNGGVVTENALTGGSGEGGGIRGDNTEIWIYGDGEISYNQGKHGGGIFLRNNGKVILDQGIITDNEAGGDGGGIYADGGELLIGNAGAVTGNKAGGDGGGIRGTGAAKITLDGGAITNNQGKVGAGISANSVSEVVMNAGSQIADNGCDNGAGGNIKTLRGGGVTMDNASFIMNGGTIIGNSGEIGGGLCLDKSKMHIYSGEITYNKADSSGGGVYLYNGESGLEAENCVISHNTVASGDGGGIYSLGRPVTLNNSEISYNTADHNGGGIFARECKLILKETTIQYNEAVKLDGGGIRGSNVKLTIEKSDISHNQGIYGAGISMNEAGSITMDADSVISHNTGSLRGGGVNIDGGTDFTMTGGTINDNQADAGGGIISNGSDLSIENGNIFGNVANSDGGGILAENNSTVELDMVTVVSNRADTDGGGLRLRNSTLTMSDSTINKNEAPNGGGISANDSSSIKMYTSSINENGIMMGLRGGGVNIDRSTEFTMNSGEINNNHAQSGGGVIASAGSTFIMKSGEISQNTSAYSGGGVRMENSQLKLMSGNIDGNQAGYHGGGVYLTMLATLEMKGGSVTNNVSAADGGGIYTENLSYLLNADVSKYSNLYIKNAVVSGNQSSSPQNPPNNAGQFTNFNGMLLTNDQINYHPLGLRITYDSNGGGGGTATEIRGVNSALPLQTIAELDFSPPGSGQEFKYWSNMPGGISAGGLYYKGDGMTPVVIDNDITFYAIWGSIAGTISGYAFLDSDRSGSYNTGEFLEGITVILYKTDESGNITDSGQTTTTDAGGRYEFQAEVHQNYKICFPVLDNDSGGNEVGANGFISKRQGDQNSHVYQSGYSDVIKLTEAKQTITKNAGYAPPFIVTSGIFTESIPWTALILFSGCAILGLFVLNRRRRRITILK